MHSERAFVIHVHIPKTAGTTLNRVLEANAPLGLRQLGNVFRGGGGTRPPRHERTFELLERDERARVLTGHVPFGLSTTFPAGWAARFVTVLRDPVDRVLSQYFMIRDDEEPYVALDLPLDQLLAGTEGIVDNLQTRMLSASPTPFGAVDSKMLEEAKRNIEQRFLLVGLTERFEETLLLLKHRLGIDDILQEPQRVNTTRLRGDDVDPELREAVERHNAYDVELLAFARDIFAKSPEFGRPEFDLDLAALRRWLSDGTSAAGEPPVRDTLDDTVWHALVNERLGGFQARHDRSTAVITAREARRDLAEAREQLAAVRQQAVQLTGELVRADRQLFAQERTRRREEVGDRERSETEVLRDRLRNLSDEVVVSKRNLTHLKLQLDLASEPTDPPELSASVVAAKTRVRMMRARRSRALKALARLASLENEDPQGPERSGVPSEGGDGQDRLPASAGAGASPRLRRARSDRGCPPRAGTVKIGCPRRRRRGRARGSAGPGAIESALRGRERSRSVARVAGAGGEPEAPQGPERSSLPSEGGNGQDRLPASAAAGGESEAPQSS